MAAVTICCDFGAQKNKVSHCFYCFPIYFPKVMGPDAMILVFWMLSFKPTFSLSTFIKRLFSSSSLSAIRVVSEFGSVQSLSRVRLFVIAWTLKVKEESEKVGLKLNIQKTKIMASGPITSWEIDGETVETVSDFIFWGLQNHCRWWLQSWN